ncbi:MAG: hypothetical protein ACE5E6_09680 [Phycisphaerae bacterium]
MIDTSTNHNAAAPSVRGGSFPFQCPCCRGWIAGAPETAGHLVRCGLCATDVVVPRLSAVSGGCKPRHHVVGRLYTCACPNCGAAQSIGSDGADRLHRCLACGARFLPATPPWQRWVRPVGRCMSADGWRRSWHVLMTGRRPERASAFAARFAQAGGSVDACPETVRDRFGRPYEYYCGACARLLLATSCLIAGEMVCPCGAVQIVPAPRRVRPARLILDARTYRARYPDPVRAHWCVDVICAACRARYTFPEALAGRTVQCAHCASVFNVPSPGDAVSPPLRRVVRLYCPRCGGKIDADAGALGDPALCPHCIDAFVIRGPTESAATAG